VTDMDFQHRTSRFHEAARALLGDRFGEIRLGRDRFIQLTVIDPTPEDVAAIDRIADDTGVRDRVRTLRADPAALRAWEELRHELIRLGEADPHALQGHPGPSPGYRRPPFEIGLAAYAVDVATMLHERFGTWVNLRVGAFTFPLDPDQPHRRRAEKSLPTIDPTEIRVELAGPLSVRSGHTTTHPLKVTNLGTNELVVKTNGDIAAEVVDPDSGKVVGGYVGGHVSPLITFPIPPHALNRIPLLVGTASFDATLGYAIPAGQWALRGTLGLRDGRTLYTPLLPFRITD
jgi:hypothetical protein